MDENIEVSDLFARVLCMLSSTLKKWKICVIIIFLSGACFDMARTFLYKPQYMASIKATLNSEENSFDQLEETVSYIESLNYILNGQVAKNYVKDQMNVDEVHFNVKVESISETNLIKLSVISNQRQEAFYGLTYIVDWYQSHMQQYQFSYQLDIIERTPLNMAAMNSFSHAKSFVIGAFISVVGILVVMFLFEYFKDVVRSPKDVLRKTDARLLVKVPKERKPRGKKFWQKSKKAILISSLKTSFAYKESINKLRIRLEHTANKHQYKVIMVTSSLENEGKSTISTNIALALEKAGKKVLFIELDFHKPSFYKIFESQTNQCINRYLEGKTDWTREVVRIKNKNNLYLLCAKEDSRYAEAYLGSQALQRLLKEASQVFDYVIIDSPPAYILDDSRIINAYVDATLLVVKQNYASTQVINTTLSRLMDVKNNVIGCVYNASIYGLSSISSFDSYRYGSYYGKGGKYNGR